MDKLPKQSWKLEPGDGTGNSIADAMVRNDQGICGHLGCGKPLPEGAIGSMAYGKLCEEHQKEIDQCRLKLIDDFNEQIDRDTIRQFNRDLNNG
jgi:hypothetical protein